MNQVREKKLPFLIFCAIVLFLPFLGKGGVLASAIIAAALVGAPLFVLIGIATLGSLFLWSGFRDPTQFTIIIEGIRSRRASINSLLRSFLYSASLVCPRITSSISV